MALPYKVEKLDSVPESARSLYEKKGDVFVLGVEGVRGVDEVGELERAFERQKEKNRELMGKTLPDTELTEFNRLKEEERLRKENKLKDEGKWEDLRTQLQTEHQQVVAPLQAKLAGRDGIIARLTVTNELQAAIAAAGIKDEYREAAEAVLMRRNPKVVYNGENPMGVFPDEVHGDQPIKDYVAKWAKTDAAKPFLPPQTKGGGGAPGTEGKPGAANDLAGKQWKDMTPEEKVRFTDEKYGAGKA